MSIRPYITPLFKWWWLIALAGILAALSSYFVTRPLPPVYTARTRLTVGQAISNPNPTGAEFTLARQLAEVYANFATLEPIRDATMKALNLQNLPRYEAYTQPNSAIIIIEVTDNKPIIAQAVANELGNQLALQSPTNPQRQEQGRMDFLNEQLDKMQQEILDTQQEIEEKQDSLAELTSAAQIADMQNQIDALQTKLSLMQTNYATMLANTQQGALNTLAVIEPAILPTVPVGPNKVLIVLMSIVAGMALAIGAAYLIEFFDNSIKTPEDVARIMDIPVLGYIPTIEHAQGPYDFVAHSPRAPTSEAFRSLRTDLGFINIDEPLKTILVVSTEPGDGKTTVASNLAISFAQAEQNVLLMETDLRRPNFSTSLGINEKPGLSDALRDNLEPHDVFQEWSKPTIIKTIPAGTMPPNPAELLGSRRMEELLQKIGEDTDIIILDGPPIIVTDSVILASKVDGVLVVLRPGITRIEDLQTLDEQMKRAGAHVIGAIFNRVKASSSYYGRRMYAQYYTQDTKPKKSKKKKGSTGINESVD